MSKAIENYNKIQPLVNAVNNAEINTLNKFLYERISNPDAYVVFLGETSSGKTTMINGLLGGSVLPTRPRPTTGGIVEIELKKGNSPDEFYAINKNATIEKLDKPTFDVLCEKPDKELLRLKMIRYSAEPKVVGGRIFDTPGFDSVVEEHEEVLKDFLPNSDVVIYTIHYAIGFQQADYDYLSSFMSLLRDNVEIVLLINCCPQGLKADDPKIKTIRTHFNALLGRVDSKVFCVLKQKIADGAKPVIPADKMWECINNYLASPKHLNTLNIAYESYVLELFKKCNAIINAEYVDACVSEKEQKALVAEQLAYAKKIRDAIPLFVEPEFSRLKNKIPQLLGIAAKNVEQEICPKIESASVFSKEEMATMVNDHYLPTAVKKQSSEISYYVENSLTHLNEKVDDYIQKETVQFDNKVNVILETNTELAGKKLGAKALGKLAEMGIQNYFIQFGGQGGIRAGLANGASHVLKEFGSVIGKQFSRQTHNAVKHFLARVGANNMKAVGTVVAVAIQLIIDGVDLATWKMRLKGKIPGKLTEWQNNSSSMILEDLEKLKKQNVDSLSKIALKAENLFNSMAQDNLDLKKIEAKLELAKKIGASIGAECL